MGILTAVLFCLLTACRSDEKKQAAEVRQSEQILEHTEQIPENTETQSEAAAVSRNILQADGNTLETRFAVPEGYTRVNCKQDSFGEFLRSYPLLPDGEQVHLYNGNEKGNQNDHMAVFDMELADGDLQQCADSVLRLYAEYFYQTKQYSRMSFHLTNGFELSFEK